MASELSAALINGLSAEMAATYKEVQNRVIDDRLRLVMDVDTVHATNAQHDYGYKESAPFMGEWKRGGNIPTEGMAAKSFNVVNHKFGKRVEWDEEDREDDQLQDLMQAARQTGEGAAILPEEFFFDLVLATVDTLPGTVLAPDGLSFFNSGLRFGDADGNIVAGGAITTTAGLLSIYYNVLARFRDFKDTKGKPLWLQQQIDLGMVLVFPSGQEKVFDEAFRQKLGIGQAATAGTSNIIADTGRDVTLWPTSRLTNDDFYCFLKGTPVPSCFVQNRRGLRERSSLGDDNNGDRTRTTGKEYIQWDLRSGAGINIPYGAIKAQPA